MKVVQFVFVVCLASLCRADDVLDALIDNWLAHARDMINATKNQATPVTGLKFYTPCGALITWENCSVTADMGVVRDLSTIARSAPVGMQDFNNRTAAVTLQLSYDVLEVFYPSLFVQGHGISLKYEGISVKPNGPLPFTLNMLLDYSNGAEDCSNSFHITPPSMIPDFVGFIQHPKPGNVPAEDLKGMKSSFIGQVADHISSLIYYEKICQKLADLF